MDVLTDVLAATKIGGTVAARVNAAAPWGVGLPKPATVMFHTVIQGTCWLRRPGAEPVPMAAGDVALVPAGGDHALASDPTGPLIDYTTIIAANRGGLGTEIDLSGPGPRTRLVCGGYQFDAHAAHPLLNLPPVLHLPAAHAAERRDLTEVLRMLFAELADPGPGSRTVTDRLVDLLFVHILRQSMRQGDAGASWLTALRDPETAAAITLIHEQPHRAWTVEELARAAGVSRATLARRFTRLVGEPPLAYLTRWRLQLAARRLGDSAESLASIARSVGYTSEFAFSRAFTRQRGIAPSRYRAARRDDANTPAWSA